MITANITTYVGQDMDAEHYYCSYVEVPDSFPPKQYNGPSGGDNLQRVLTESQAIKLRKKDGFRCWDANMKTNRFDSIKQIHDELKKEFENQIIVTYFENRLFKEMLYFKDGVNLGYKAFGEVWVACLNQCWTDLLPDKKDIKIKCECGKEYSLDQVSYETDSFDNDAKKRNLTKFYTKRNFEDETGEDLCCKYFYLMWNVIL